MVRNRIPGGFDMNVNILTSGYWPSYPIVDAKMPAELSDYQQVLGFDRSWHTNVGTVGHSSSEMLSRTGATSVSR